MDLYSPDICEALGISFHQLDELADREGIERRGGFFGLDEVKRIAARLIVAGSPVERENAKRTLKELANLPPPLA